MRRLEFMAWGVLSLGATLSIASIPTDSLGEGTCVGLIPVRADTIRDTSFHAGDTIVLATGEMIVKPRPEERQEIAIPSVKTTVRIVAGDGFASGTVTQVFRNPFNLPFEATYIFPLPHDGAVHGMDFRTRSGVYHADLLEKEEAKQRYEEAKLEGKQASLLMQGQDNIFIQKLCNIMPGDSVSVVITFSMALQYDMGAYELAFPTTMIPRYDPAPMGKVRANPTYVPSDTRDGSTLDFSILVLTPYEIAGLTCPSHEVTVDGGDAGGALTMLGMLGAGESIPPEYNPSLLRLAARQTIPNRDIVVRFSRVNAARGVSSLSYHDGMQGYFALNIFPSLIDTAVETPQAVDMVFVIDKSGSMSGSPIAKAKEIMRAMLDKIRPEDRMSFLAFDYTTDSLFSTPAPATAANIVTARAWIDNLQASGGTEMLQGVKQALSVPLETGRTRIMSLITDGAIGGVDAIYEAIRNDPSNTIVFAFGVGSSPNRELIDGAATAGRGIGRNLLLGDDVEQVVADFWTRIRLPQIENVQLTWSAGDQPTALTQTVIPGLWLGQPVLLFGKYLQGGVRTVTLSGTKAGVPVSETYQLYFVSRSTLMESVPKMWARETIENLMQEQIAAGDESNKDKVLEVSLAYEVLCRYTAFLAVADSVVNENGEMIAADVPIPVPQGVDPTMAGAQMYYTIGAPLTMRAEADSSFNLAPVLPGEMVVAAVSSLEIMRTATGIAMALHNVSAEGEVAIYDLKGRMVVKWSIADLAAHGCRWTWAYTDAAGKPVARGTYVLAVWHPQLRDLRTIAYR